ncbi:MAG: type II toxin-antitoxin system RelE/ParE family toxin [Bryobacteraceae bacterium]
MHADACTPAWTREYHKSPGSSRSLGGGGSSKEICTRQRSLRAAEMFLDELDCAIAAIESDPARYPEYLFGARRTILRRFPYLIVFRTIGSDVEVIAVAHGHRRPGYWRARAE